MKNLTINEFTELVKGKRWDACTIGTGNSLNVVFSGAMVALSPNNKAMVMSIAKDDSSAQFSIRIEKVTAIELHIGYIFMRFQNLPAMVFTESKAMTIEEIQTEAPA